MVFLQGGRIAEYLRCSTGEDERLLAASPKPDLLRAPKALTGVALSLLTVLLLAYPKRMTLEYAPVEATRVFAHLPVFALIYYAWAFALLWPVLSSRFTGMMRYHGLLLVVVFSVIARGMWDFLLPDQWGDGLASLTTVNVIRSMGHLPLDNRYLAYSEFPGLHLLTDSLSLVMGTNVFRTASIVLFAMGLMIAVFTYIVILAMLSDPAYATVGSLVSLQGNLMFGLMFFSAVYFGWLLSMISVAVLLRAQGSDFPPRRGGILVLATISALAVTHFVSAALWSSLLACYWILRRVSDSKAVRVLLATILSVVFPLTWISFFSHRTFSNLVEGWSRIVQNLSGGFLTYLLTVTTPHLTGGVPFWVSGVRLFWLFLAYITGSLAILYYLIASRRRLSTPEGIIMAGSFGTLIITLLGTIGSPGGAEYARYFLYAPLFTVPFALKYARERWSPHRVATLRFLALLWVVASYPTFLVHHARVEQYAFYPWEYAAGSFLKVAYAGREGEPKLFGMGGAVFPVAYYLPSVEYAIEGQLGTDFRSREDFWRSVFGALRRLKNEAAHGKEVVFISSLRPRVYYRHLLGIPVDDPRWGEVLESVTKSRLIYSNGYLNLSSN